MSLESLLSTGQWEAAVSYVRVLVRNARSRADGQRLRSLLVGAGVPPEVRGSLEWRSALAWVAFRTADGALLEGVLAAQEGDLPAFRAFRAALVGDWLGVGRWAEQALAEERGAERGVAARYRALALSRLAGQLGAGGGWKEAFDEALALTVTRRDKGLVFLELAHALIGAGLEGEARDALSQAVAHLRGDDWGLALAYSNLGIACLRLKDAVAAERALKRAVEVASRPDGHEHLPTAWRGLGGTYFWSGQWARAAHAYRMAEVKAANVRHTVEARRSRARLLRTQGLLDEALEVLRSAILHAKLSDGECHPLYVDIASVLVLLGDGAGAQAALKRGGEGGDITDGWRRQVVEAELARLSGEPEFERRLEGVNLRHVWTQGEAWSFPLLFAALGLPTQPPDWVITVNLDGPIRVSMNGSPTALKPTSAEAALLAFLLIHGGEASVPRVLEALSLPGSTVRRRRQALNKIVARLRLVLGWPDAVTYQGDDLLCLSQEPRWNVRVSQQVSRLDDFCEGCAHPWVDEYRSESLARSIPELSET